MLSKSCESCTGEQRVKCAGVLSTFRDETKVGMDELTDVLESNLVVGIFDQEQAATDRMIKAVSGLVEIGCTLTVGEHQIRLISEVLAVATLQAFEEEERMEAKEAERQARLKVLFEESDRRREEHREVLDRIAAREPERLRHIAEAEELLARIRSGLQPSDVETIPALASERADIKAKEFCADKGWDVDNLSLVQRLDLNSHLRSEGFIS